MLILGIFQIIVWLVTVQVTRATFWRAEIPLNGDTHLQRFWIAENGFLDATNLTDADMNVFWPSWNGFNKKLSLTVAFEHQGKQDPDLDRNQTVRMVWGLRICLDWFEGAPPISVLDSCI